MTQRFDRRAFLRASAATAAGLALPSALLAACTKAATTSGGGPVAPDATGGSGIAWPIDEDHLPVPSGLEPEQDATLRIYQYRDYLSKRVLDAFERKYRQHGVRIETESFRYVQEAIDTLTRDGSDFDVFFPTIDTLGRLASTNVLAPLNHDYLPNIKNLWPRLQPPNGPAYDVGLRYSTPYTVYTTGIGWRSDLVPASHAPDRLDNPYDVFWDPALRGKVGLYDDYREALAMALLHDGFTDVNTADRAALDSAAADLMSMGDVTAPTATYEGAYEGLPEGEFAVHQAWSGDMIYGAFYAKEDGDDFKHLRYWWPGDGRGVIGVDLMAVPTQGKNPVLAHLFLNHLLDYEVAMDNFSWNGYQPPLEGTAPQDFAGSRWSKLVPPALTNTLARPQDLETGSMLLGLDPSTDQMWKEAWERKVPAG